MNTRVSIFGKGQGQGQGLDRDLTSTGAICIASQARGKVGGRRWLLQGDKTTACPRCGEEGTLVNGETRWRQDGIPSGVDGTPVKCGCPPGSNYVIAQSQHHAPPQAAIAPPTGTAKARPVQRPSPSPAQAFNSRSSVSAMPGSLEPGFHIVQRHSTFAQLLMKLFDAGNPAPISRLQRLNPTFAEGFKAGEIFVIGDPDNGHACTREEAELMTAAERARSALTGLNENEADFMMQHIGEIAGLLNGASQSMGVGKDMLAYGLGRVEDTLKGIERLHQQEFMKHGHLNSS